MKRIRKTPKKPFSLRSHKTVLKGPAQRRPLREEIAVGNSFKVYSLRVPYVNLRHYSARPLVDGAIQRHRLAARIKREGRATYLNPAWN